MKMTAQFIISMVLAVGLVAAGSAYLLMRQEQSNQTDELNRRSALVAEGLEESVSTAMTQRSTKDLQRILRRFENKSRLTGIVVFDVKDKVLAGTTVLLKSLPEKSDLVAEVIDTRQARGEYVKWRGKSDYAYAYPIVLNDQPAGALLIVHAQGAIAQQLLRPAHRRNSQPGQFTGRSSDGAEGQAVAVPLDHARGGGRRVAPAAASAQGGKQGAEPTAGAVHGVHHRQVQTGM
jgi:hypothetical protein